MNLDEYREWLDKNGNQEEKMAYEIAKEVIEYHLSYNSPDDWSEKLYPRKWVRNEKDNLEFDLLIELNWKQSTWTGERKYRRIIGIEFKETDFRKVVDQAILRSRYVDYMWIATRDVFADEFSFLEMLEHGIGWIIWDEDFVKILFPAKYTKSEIRSEFYIRYLAEKEVRRAVQNLMNDSKVSAGVRSLFDFMEG